jgi:hypothetical protein
VSRFGMRIAPPLFVAGIGAGSFSSVVLALHGSPRPLWAFLVLGAALASCLVCRGKSRGSAIYLARSPFSACGPA